MSENTTTATTTTTISSKATLVPCLEAFSDIQQLFQGSELPNPKGPSSLLTRQLILHLYSPKISVISSDLADQITAKYQYLKFLDFLQCFEDNIYGSHSFLNNRVHVKFIKPIDELLRNQMELKNDRRNNMSSELFEMRYLKPLGVDNMNYLKLINQVSSSQTILPFETFNHPILQLIVISLQDSIPTIKTLINDWKYLNYPKWIDLGSMFLMFLIVVDTSKLESLEQAVKLQEHLKLQMNFRSVIVIHPEEEKSMVVLKPSLGSSFNEGTLTTTRVGAKFTHTINNMIVDLINKYLIPFMEKKMAHWTETLVNPRKSFTGRLFNVGKRWGGGNSSSLDQSSGSSQNYNSVENHYYVNSSEFLIRRLGDWYFMLRDYKKSYTTYELLKKDFLNDKSWNYLASLQEFMILSLLVGSSQKISMIGNGLTTKIMNDLIIPMIDSLQYSYLSRCYLRTYTLRSIITIAELFISLGESNQQFKINNNNSIYFDQGYQLFNRLIDLNLIDEETKSVIMTRISYIYDIYYLDLRDSSLKKPHTEVDEYKEKYMRDDYEIIGMTRHRKSAMWEHLAKRKQEETGMLTGLSTLTMA